MHNEIIKTFLTLDLGRFYSNELRANNVITNKAKRSLNIFLDEFKKADLYIDKMFEDREDYARQLSEIIERYIEKLAIDIWDMENMCILYDIYRQHPKETEDFVNKMLNLKTNKNE